jgi:hypothetical protein
MAVAIDSNPNTDAGGNGVTTVNFTGLTMGSVTNPALICLIAYDTTSGATISSVNWDATGTPQALTLIPGTATSNGVGATSALYGRVGPITAGAKTLRVVLSSTSTLIVSAISFSGVDQTGGATSFPHGTAATGSSTAPSVAITTAVGNRVVGGGSEPSAGITVNQTQVYNDTAQSLTNGWGNTAAGAAGTVTLTATLGGTSLWCYSGTDVAAAGAGGAVKQLINEIAQARQRASYW